MRSALYNFLRVPHRPSELVWHTQKKSCSELHPMAFVVLLLSYELDMLNMLSNYAAQFSVSVSASHSFYIHIVVCFIVFS
jgi:hypothetical protein